MRILYLTPSGQLGGAEATLLSIMSGIARAAPQWSQQIVTGSYGPFVERVRQSGFPAEVLAFSPRIARLGDSGASWLRRAAVVASSLVATLQVISYVRRLRQVILRADPDAVHASGFKMQLLAACATPRSIPLVWHVHDYVRSRPLMSRLLRLASFRTTAAIAISRSIAADVEAAFGGTLRVETFLNAVDTRQFSPEGPRFDLDAAAGFPPVAERVTRVGLVATLARWKGHAIFLEAISKLPRELPLRAYIVGGPQYQTAGSQYQIRELHEMARAFGVSDRVAFTGFIEDSAAAIRSLDVVVHASTSPEPFGMVIAEAMACGKPVIVSRGGGAAEISEVGVNALDHAAGDAACLADRIALLLRDPELRSRMGQAARRRAVESFDSARLAAELISFYSSLNYSGKCRQARLLSAAAD